MTNPIHIGMMYREALKSKREVLQSQVVLLKTAKIINNFKTYREKEFELKEELAKKIKEAKTGINKLQKILPKPKIPKILEDKGYSKQETYQKKKTPSKKDDLEAQLQEIQNRLNQLQERSSK